MPAGLAQFNRQGLTRGGFSADLGRSMRRTIEAHSLLGYPGPMPTDRSTGLLKESGLPVRLDPQGFKPPSLFHAARTRRDGLQIGGICQAAFDPLSRHRVKCETDNFRPARRDCEVVRVASAFEKARARRLPSRRG